MAAELEWARLMIDLMLPGEKARVAPFPMYRHDSEVWGGIVVTLVFPPPCSINLERTGEEPGEPHGKSSSPAVIQPPPASKAIFPTSDPW